jgi:hypothetical protein
MKTSIIPIIPLTAPPQGSRHKINLIVKQSKDKKQIDLYESLQNSAKKSVQSANFINNLNLKQVKNLEKAILKGSRTICTKDCTLVIEVVKSV